MPHSRVLKQLKGLTKSHVHKANLNYLFFISMRLSQETRLWHHRRWSVLNLFSGMLSCPGARRVADRNTRLYRWHCNRLRGRDCPPGNVTLNPSRGKSNESFFDPPCKCSRGFHFQGQALLLASRVVSLKLACSLARTDIAKL